MFTISAASQRDGLFEDGDDFLDGASDSEESLKFVELKETDTVSSKDEPEKWQNHVGNVRFLEFVVMCRPDRSDMDMIQEWIQQGGRFVCEKNGAFTVMYAASIQKKLQNMRTRSTRYQSYEELALRDTDVVCGHRWQEHSGNKIFFELVRDSSRTHNMPGSAVDDVVTKPVQDIIKQIDVLCGRFVQGDEHGWFVLNEREKLDKVQTALQRCQSKTGVGKQHISIVGIADSSPQHQVKLGFPSQNPDLILQTIGTAPKDSGCEVSADVLREFNQDLAELFNEEILALKNNMNMEDPRAEGESHKQIVKESSPDKSNEFALTLTLLNSATEPETAGKVLSNLRDFTCFNVNDSVKIASMGGIKSVIATMQQHLSNADVQFTGCKVLRNFALNKVEHRHSIAAAGGIKCIIDGMKEHARIDIVQEAGCQALSYLALDNVNNRGSIATEGGINVVMDAMIQAMENDFEGVQEAGWSALANLAKENDGNKAIIAKLANTINVNARTPLMDACQKGRVSVVQILLECGADVDIETQNGRTALFFACQKGHESTVQILLDVGADATGIGRARNHPAIARKLELHHKMRSASKIFNLTKVPYFYCTAQTVAFVPHAARRPEVVSLRVWRAFQRLSVAPSFSAKGREARCVCIDGTIFIIRFFAGSGKCEHGVIVEIIPVSSGTDPLANHTVANAVLEAAKGKPYDEESQSPAFLTSRGISGQDEESALRLVHATVAKLEKKMPSGACLEPLGRLVRITESESSIDAGGRVVSKALVADPKAMGVMLNLLKKPSASDKDMLDCLFAMMALANCLQNLHEYNASVVQEQPVDLSAELYPILVKYLRSADDNLQLAYQSARCLEPLLSLFPSLGQDHELPGLMKNLTDIGSLRHAALREQVERCLPMVGEGLGVCVSAFPTANRGLYEIPTSPRSLPATPVRVFSRSPSFASLRLDGFQSSASSISQQAEDERDRQSGCDSSVSSKWSAMSVDRILLKRTM